MNSNTLRKQTLAARDQLAPDIRREKSDRIVALLTAHPVFAAAKHLFIYVDFCSEVETRTLIGYSIAIGKTVSVPRVLCKESRLIAVPIRDPANQLEPGCFGILEPEKMLAAADPATIDAALIPGSVFDQTGGRFGYGGGFYDRFLSRDAPQAFRIGLAYTLQLIDRVPTEAHDQLMDILVTEEQIYDCRKIRHAQNSGVQGCPLSATSTRR